MVGRSISGTQKDVDTKSDSDRCVAMAADGLQLSTFRVSKDEPGRRWERHTISMRPPITLVKTFQIQETRDKSSVLVRTVLEFSTASWEHHLGVRLRGREWRVRGQAYNRSVENTGESPTVFIGSDVPKRPGPKGHLGLLTRAAPYVHGFTSREREAAGV